MSRLRSWCLLSLLLLTLLAPAVAAEGTRRLTSSPLAPGAAHEVWALEGSTARGHLVRVAPDSPVRLRVVPAQGGLAGRETPSSICRRTRGCRAAVNGDYFSGSAPVGGAVARGRLLRSPAPDHEQVSLDPLRATTRGLGDDGWTGLVRAPDGAVLPLEAVNRGVSDGQTVLWTPDAGATTPPCSCLEVVLAELGGRVGVLGAPASVRAVRRAAGGTPLEAGTAVLAASGAAADRLTAAVDAAAGRPWEVAVSTALPTRENLGAHPVLLRDGRPTDLDPEDPALRDPHPRTVVAWDRAGTAWLGVLEGRQPGGPGTTAPELVGFLQARGATEAVLLDGGGSSALVAAEGPLSRPSDGAERPVANAVVVVWDPPPRRTTTRQAAVARPEPLPQATVVATRPATRAPAPAPAQKAAPRPAPAAPRPVPTRARPTAPAPVVVRAPALPVRVPEPQAAPAAPPLAVVLPVPAPSGVDGPLALVAAGLAAAAALAWVGTACELVRRSGPAPR